MGSKDRESIPISIKVYPGTPVKEERVIRYRGKQAWVIPTWMGYRSGWIGDESTGWFEGEKPELVQGLPDEYDPANRPPQETKPDITH